MKIGNEIRVGLVFLAGLGVIILGYFKLRTVGFNADTYYIELKGAATIAQGNDVRLQGVKIGQVVDVDFAPETQQPILRLAVRRTNPELHLLKSYTYTISNAGIVGESYVDIRGQYDPKSDYYPANDPSVVIPGRSGGGVTAVADSANQIIKDFRVTVGKLNVTLDRINKGVLNYDNQQKLAETMEGVAKLTNSAAHAFGPQGIRFGFGDPSAQANLNRTMMYAANAARQAELAANNISSASNNVKGITGDLRHDLKGVTSSIIDENRAKISSMLDGLTKATNNIAGLTESLDFALKQGKFAENAGAVFANLNKATDNIQIATLQLRKLSEDQATQDDLKKSLTAMRESMEALRDTAQSIRNLTTDEGTNGQFKGALTSLGTTAKNLQDITSSLKTIVTDPQLQGDLKGAAANLNGTLEATRSSAERINSLLGGRRRRSTTSPATGVKTPGAEPQKTGYAPGGLDFTYRYLYGKDDDRRDRIDGSQFGDVTFNGEFFGGPVRLGLSNIGEGTDVTAQAGRFVGSDNAIRYGLYRSKLGVGAEAHRGRFSLEGNAWDPNHGSYNLYGGYQLTPNLELMAGWESLGGTRANALAIRISP